MPTHRKLRRKELKQPDALVTFVEDAREFLTANFTQLVVAAAVVAGVAAIAFSFYFYERHRDRTAAAEFYDAFNALGAKHYKQAEDGFRRLAADEPNRELGRLARIYLADCLIVEKDLPRARDALVAYLAGAHDPLFAGLALNELGVLYEQMGDFKRAQGAYSQAAQVPGPQAAMAQLAAARMLARTGERQAAIGAYRRFLNEHPFVAERQDATEALAELGAPVETAAPAPRTVMPAKAVSAPTSGLH